MEQNITFPYDGADPEKRKWYDYPWWARVIYMVWVPWLFVWSMWFGQETVVQLGLLGAWMGTWSWVLGDVFVYAMIIAASVSFIIVGVVLTLEE